MVAALRLLEHGARHLLLLSRSGKVAKESWSMWEQVRMFPGAVVEVMRCDVCKISEVQALFAAVRNAGRSIGGVIHTAGVLRDRMVRGMTGDDFDVVCAPKVGGACSIAHVMTF